MKNAAFAVDPCPKDLLGKQFLFLHMSNHYRKMFSAQSVVDSAPPSSLKAFRARSAANPRSPRTARRSRPHTAADSTEGLPSTPQANPRATSASGATKPVACYAYGYASPASVPVAQQVLQRQSVRAQRSAQFSKGVRLSQKPSRADTDPGPCPRVGLDNRRASTAASASRCHFQYSTSVLPKPPGTAHVRQRRRNPEKSGTYYNKLNQLVPDRAPQRSKTRTTGQFISEELTSRVPHKPQVLRTEVPSRLLFCSSYCPPRAKLLRTKTGVQGKEIRDAQQPIWTSSQTSPPVSSRDSAYNGGISSGGESRGPTPDHRGPRKHSKERKSKKKGGHRRPHTADDNSHRNLENKLVNKFLIDERNELKNQRLRVNPLHGISQEDHGDEILRTIHNLYSDSNEDDTMTEPRSPANSGILSDQSIEEDMAEEADEAVEVYTNKEDEDDDSYIKDESCASKTSLRKSHSPSEESYPLENQAETQTDACIVKNISRDNSSASEQHHSFSSSHSVQNSLASNKVSHPQLSNLSPKHQSTKISTSEIENASHIAGNMSEDKHASPTYLKPEPLKQIDGSHHDTGVGSFTKSSTYNSVSYSKLKHEISKLKHEITQDVLQQLITTSKGFKAVSEEHMQSYIGKLDMVTMQQEVDKLLTEMNGKSYVVDPVKEMDTPFIFSSMRSPLDVETKSPIVTQPHSGIQTGKKSDLHSVKMFEMLDSSSKPVFAAEEEIRGHNSFYTRPGSSKSFLGNHENLSNLPCLPVDSKLSKHVETSVKVSDHIQQQKSLSFNHNLKEDDSSKCLTASIPFSIDKFMKNCSLPQSNESKSEETMLQGLLVDSRVDISISDKNSNIPNVCTDCTELACRCANSSRIKIAMAEWLNGRSCNSKLLEVKSKNLVAHVSDCAQETVSEAIRKGEKCEMKTEKHCRCHPPVNFFAQPEEEKLELVTLFCKKEGTKYQKCESNIASRKYDLALEGKNEINTGTINSNDRTLLEDRSEKKGSELCSSSISLGTGVNSDIVRHLREIQRI